MEWVLRRCVFALHCIYLNPKPPLCLISRPCCLLLSLPVWEVGPTSPEFILLHKASPVWKMRKKKKIKNKKRFQKRKKVEIISKSCLKSCWTSFSCSAGYIWKKNLWKAWGKKVTGNQTNRFYVLVHSIFAWHDPM